MTEAAETLIPRRSLHAELAGRLRDMMMRGELRPGDKIAEPALCERFGVSRTPLREALKVLAAEGLVVLSPNRGASVACVSGAEIDELFPIMGALEALAGEGACGRATDGDIERIQALHESMVARHAAGDLAGSLALNRRIHEAIFEIAGNRALAQLYETLIVRTHAVRFIAQKSPERWRETIAGHDRIMAALRARDGAKLGRLLREHLAHLADTVREALAELDAAGR